MKESIIKYWFMARSSNPQYVVARSPTCIASGALCLITVGIFIRVIAKNEYYHYTDEKSGYNNLVVISIVFIQIFAIILGTIGPASRCMWWSEVFFKNSKLIFNNGGYFKVEEYWFSSLVKRREAPLRVNFKGILIRKIIRFFKWYVLTLLIVLQVFIISTSKLIRAVSVVPMLFLHKILQVLLHRYFFHPAATTGIVIYFVRLRKKDWVFFNLFIVCLPYIILFLMRSYLTCLKKKFQLDRLPIIMDEQQHLISDNYILHLEGETGFVSFVTGEDHESQRNNKKRKKEKKNALLVRLIQQKSTLMEGFKFVTAFGGTKKSFSHPDLLHRSWALPLVILTCVAVTLQGVDRKQVQLLLQGVKRGLKFVNLIEQSFDDKSLVNMREAAEFVWLGIDLDHRWFNYHFPSEYGHPRNEDAREVVEELRRIATNHVLEFKNRAGEDACINKPYEWPPTVLAADCMHTVCSTILQNYSRYETSTLLLQWLETVVSDILGACLTNLPEVIHIECSKKSIEVREEGVWNAANLFVDTEDLLVLLYDPVVVSKFPEKKKYIEEWQSGDEGLSLNSEPSVAQLGGVLMDVVVARG